MTRSGKDDRHVFTKDIQTAVNGHEIEILDKLGIRWPGGKPHIRCPYRDHTDNNPSWRWDQRKSRAICTCTNSDSIFDVVIKVENLDFGRAKIRIAELLGRSDLIRERRSKKREGGGTIPPEQQRNSATPAGCRLAEYADTKQLPAEFLRSLGLTEITYLGKPAIRIPYYSEDGTEAAIRFRRSLHKSDDGDNRFAWRSGDKARLYGLHRLVDAIEAGYVCLVEGESDAQTLWFHNFPGLGLPGANDWNEQRDAPLLADIPVIYVVIEPDRGGDHIVRWLACSAIAARVRLVRLPVKDSSALYLADPDGFRANFQAALNNAEPYQAMADREAKAEGAAAREAAGDLIFEPNILGRLATELERAGLVGEEKNAKVLFLALTTRLFERPVSVAVKGVSSGGKSFTVEIVLRFLPAKAYWSRTAMSERALAYSDEDFRHRHLVIYEAAGMTSEFGSYLIRSLLSEGRIDYEFTEKTRDGMKARVIRKEGPTGLIVTTTVPKLHPENETRLLSLNVKDTTEQTAAIMRALARGEEPGATVDYARWQAYQKWLETGERRVIVPFAEKLATLVPPVAVRLRRDFGLLLVLIRAHALLHRELRERDDRGHTLATLDDYAAVCELISDLFSEGIEATVSEALRKTVETVQRLAKDEVSVAEIAKELKLDRSSVSRRVGVAVARGYLVNNETGRGRPARITLGDPMPGEIDMLPHPARLADRCTVAVPRERIETPFPPVDCNAELAEIEI
jgi:hypothetical protein